MLVVPRDGDATLVVPRLEAPRVVEQPGVFTLRAVGRDRRPDRRSSPGSPAGASTVAVGDQMWARFLVELLPQLPGAAYRRAVDVVGPLRMVKDAAEIDALRAAGAAADRVAAQLHAGEIPLVGRTEAEVSADISAAAASPRATTRSTSPSSPPARTPPARTTTRGDRVIERGRDRAVRLRRHDGTATAATSRAACSPATSPAGGRRGLRRAARGPGGGRRRRRRSARRARTSTAPPARSSPTPATASSSSTAPATASAWRSTRTPTSSRATRRPLAAGHAFSIEPGHLRRRPVGDAPRGHRRRHGGRPGAAQRRRPPPRQRRRLTSPAAVDRRSDRTCVGSVVDAPSA